MSQKPVFEKLRIKENYKVLIVNEPEGYRGKLGNLPPKVVVTNSTSQKPFDLVQFFVTTKKEMEKQLVSMKTLLSKNGDYFGLHIRKELRKLTGTLLENMHKPLACRAFRLSLLKKNGLLETKSCL